MRDGLAHHVTHLPHPSGHSPMSTATSHVLGHHGSGGGGIASKVFGWIIHAAIWHIVGHIISWAFRTPLGLVLVVAVLGFLIWFGVSKWRSRSRAI